MTESTTPIELRVTHTGLRHLSYANLLMPLWFHMAGKAELHLEGDSVLNLYDLVMENQLITKLLNDLAMEHQRPESLQDVFAILCNIRHYINSKLLEFLEGRAGMATIVIHGVTPEWLSAQCWYPFITQEGGFVGTTHAIGPTVALEYLDKGYPVFCASSAGYSEGIESCHLIPRHHLENKEHTCTFYTYAGVGESSTWLEDNMVVVDPHIDIFKVMLQQWRSSTDNYDTEWPLTMFYGNEPVLVLNPPGNDDYRREAATIRHILRRDAISGLLHQTIPDFFLTHQPNPKSFIRPYGTALNESTL